MSKVFKETPVLTALLVRLDHKARLARLGRQVLMELLAKLVRRDLSAHREFKEFKVILEPMVQPVLPGSKAVLVRLVLMARLVRLDPKAIVARLVQMEQQGRLDPRGMSVPLDRLAQMAHRVLQVQQDRKAYRVCKGLLA